MLHPRARSSMNRWRLADGGRRPGPFFTRRVDDNTTSKDHGSVATVARNRPFMTVPLTGRYLSFEEREEIALLKAQGAGVREIARHLGRDPSTVSRELRRNAATRGGRLDYRASVAQWCRRTTSHVGRCTTWRVGLGVVIMAWIHLLRRG
jgi:transposase-like protein